MEDIVKLRKTYKLFFQYRNNRNNRDNSKLDHYP